MSYPASEPSRAIVAERQEDRPSGSNMESRRGSRPIRVDELELAIIAVHPAFELGFDLGPLNVEIDIGHESVPTCFEQVVNGHGYGFISGRISAGSLRDHWFAWS